MAEEHCAICWAVIPEGRWVCPDCARRVLRSQPTDKGEQGAKKRGLFARIKMRFKGRSKLPAGLRRGRNNET